MDWCSLNSNLYTTAVCMVLSKLSQQDIPGLKDVLFYNYGKYNTCRLSPGFLSGEARRRGRIGTEKAGDEVIIHA